MIEGMTDVRPGLEGVVAASTRLSSVDGEAGRLVIGGYAVEEIAPRAELEEMIYLLWNGTLPRRDELAALRQRFAAAAPLPEGVLDLLRSAARNRRAPMDALRMAAAALDIDGAYGDAMDGAGDSVGGSAYDGARDGAGDGTGDGASDGARDDAMDVAVTIAARVPTIVATYWRLLQRAAPVVETPAGAGIAARYLTMIEGREPAPARVRALETYLNTIVDHGLNASTFTARIVASTGSDLVSAIAAGVGALKGPLHGGAPGPALEMVFEIGSVDRAEDYLREKLARGERLMGFGHRVYRVRDPRADVLAAAARELFAEDGDAELYELATGVERIALRLLEEAKPGRRLQTNVEFYTALLLHGLGLPVELFTPTFAVGRVAGWLAHALEQRREGRLIRPASVYTGAVDGRWTSIEDR